MNFESFLSNDSNPGVDFKGRTLQNIWSYSDNEIEDKHDFIQIIFPLNQQNNVHLKNNSHLIIPIDIYSE
tara:strand:- start:551 stop:760 length:210 start_codon:yes stop_codon:yes gene_type:complete